MDWQWGGILAASSQPRRTVISIPTTSLAGKSGGRFGSGSHSCGCNRWLRCGRAGKSHNACLACLSSKSSVAALQLGGVKHSGVVWVRQGVHATSSGPWGRIVGVELAIVGICRGSCRRTAGSAACSICLTTILDGTTHRPIGVAGGIAVCHLNAARFGPRLRVVSVYVVIV